MRRTSTLTKTNGTLRECECCGLKSAPANNLRCAACRMRCCQNPVGRECRVRPPVPIDAEQ